VDYANAVIASRRFGGAAILNCDDLHGWHWIAARRSR